MHQRSCHVIHGLNDELLTELEQQSTENSTTNTSTHSTFEETDVQPRSQALSSCEAKTLVGAGHSNPQILGVN
jgi:hypothetical protein